MNQPDPDIAFINRGVGMTMQDLHLLIAEKEVSILGLKKELEQVKNDYLTLKRSLPANRSHKKAPDVSNS